MGFLFLIVYRYVTLIYSIAPHEKRLINQGFIDTFDKIMHRYVSLSFTKSIWAATYYFS